MITPPGWFQAGDDNAGLRHYNVTGGIAVNDMSTLARVPCREPRTTDIIVVKAK